MTSGQSDSSPKYLLPVPCRGDGDGVESTVDNWSNFICMPFMHCMTVATVVEGVISKRVP